MLYQQPVLITFLVPQPMLKQLELERCRRAKEAGHVSRSSLLREFLAKGLASTTDSEKARSKKGTV